jgi:hypothetical protein
MIGARVTLATFDTRQVTRAAERAERQATFRGAAYVRSVARRSLGRPTKKRTPAPVGRPPRSQSGRLRRGIAFAVEGRGRAVIGAKASRLGKSGRAHEIGGRYKRRKYDRRPFMVPALERSTERVRELWRGSIR